MSTESQRQLHFRRMDCEADIGGGANSCVRTEPPDPKTDYRESSLKELLDLDLHNAVLLLEPTYYCNLRCSFCALPVTSRTALDWDRISTILQTLAICGVNFATLTGGEPGIIERLPHIFDDLRRWGMRSGMLTHGLWAANQSYLGELLEKDCLDLIVMSVKAVNRTSFGAITKRPLLYDKQLIALKNIAAARHTGTLRNWSVSYVVTEDNVASLTDLSWLDDLAAVPDIVFSLMEPYLPDMAKDVPAYDIFRRTIPQLTAALDRRGVNHRFEGFPLCFLGDVWRKSRDIDRKHDSRWRIVIQPRDDADYVLTYRGYQRLQQFDKIIDCKECALIAQCPGIHARMIGRHRVEPILQGAYADLGV